MIYYSAHAGGERTRNALRAAGFGLLGSAAYRWTDTEWRPVSMGGLGWAIDNGAWSAYRAGTVFDDARFERAIRECGPVDFVVCPDVVMDWGGTVALRERWLARLLNDTPHRVLLPVQNGATLEEVAPFLGERVGVFVGGDTGWKLSTMGQWVRLATERGAWSHVGRVNSTKRLALVRAIGATSADGSGCSQFSDTAARVARGLSGPVQVPLLAATYRGDK